MSALALFFILAPQQVSTQSGDETAYEAFSHDPDKDVEGLTLNETGLWSDGELFWTSGFGYTHLRAYELDGGARRTDRDVPLFRRQFDDSSNDYSRGLWSDGYTIWVVNHWQDKTFAYDLVTGERQAHREFSWPYRRLSDLSPGTYPAGLWSDGETIHVALYGSKALQGIDLATGKRLSSIGTSAEGGDPIGIWSDGRTIWVANRANGTINAYNLQTKRRTPALDFTEAARAAGNHEPRALWSDGRTIVESELEPEATPEDQSEDPAALTAAISNLPASLSSATPFIVRLSFSEPPANLSYVVVRDEAFSISGGTVTRAKRVDGRNDLWDITINPDGGVDVVVTIEARSDCETAPVICATGDRPLSENASVTIPWSPPPS